MLYGPCGLRLAIAIGLSVCAGSALAQSTTISFTNTDIPPIPLRDGSSVNIDSSGNVQAQCVLADGETTCEGISAGGDGDQASATLTRTDSNTEVIAGEQITLQWGSGGGADVCVGTSNPSVSNWNGVKATAGGTANLTLSTVGTQALSLECYNEHGSEGPASVSVEVGENTGGGGTENCTGISGPLVKPAGFTEFEQTWGQAFFGNVYPSTGSVLAPVGSFTLGNGTNSGPEIAGKYITVPFTPSTGVYKLNWLQAQPIRDCRISGACPEQWDYSSSNTAAKVYVTVSTCKGDFRLADSGAADPLLKPACRKLSGSTSIFYSGTTFGSTSCAVTVGQRYYLNILFADPTDGLTATEDSCNGNLDRCDANFKHEQQSQ